MHIKIHRGTPASSDDSLCNTCRHSRITRGHKLDEELVVCNASHTRETHITFKVTWCSAFNDQNYASYYELLQQAWILQPQSRKRPAGFVRASDLQDEELERLTACMRRHDDDD